MSLRPLKKLHLQPKKHRQRHPQLKRLPQRRLRLKKLLPQRRQPPLKKLPPKRLPQRKLRLKKLPQLNNPTTILKST